MVHDIAQDRDGALWLATWEGMARFNSHRFTTHDSSNIPGMRSRGFRAVLAEPDGSLLLGSAREGLWRYEHGRWAKVDPLQLGEARITTLTRSSDGSLWIGTEGEVLQQQPDGQLRQRYGPNQGMPEVWVLHIHELANGRYWVTTGAGLYELDPVQRRARLVVEPGLPRGNVLRDVLRTREGTTYVATDVGLLRHDGDRFTSMPAPFNQAIRAMLQSADGALWLLTAASGLLRWQGERIDHIDARQGFNGRGTGTLLQDREGLIWAGSSHGLYRVSAGPVSSLTPANGLSDDYVRSVLAAADGSIWIGGNRGVDRYRDGHLQAVAIPWTQGQPVTVFGLAEDADGVWLGTAGDGVFRIPQRSGAPVLHLGVREGLPSAYIRSLASARDGGLWIGTISGLAYRGRDGRLRSLGEKDGFLPIGEIRAIHEQPDGRLWLAGNYGMLVREPDGRFRRYDRFSSPAFPASNAFDFLDGGDGQMWIASDRGLLRLRDNRFTVYGMRHGLRNESIFRLLQDARGDLWMSSNRGVFHVPRAQFDEIDSGQRRQLAVDVYDEDSGMPDSQANGNSFPAGAMDAVGRLWIPTVAGVGVIHTGAVAAAPREPPPLLIESVEVNGSRIDLRQPLAWPSRDVHRIRIEFSGISFRHVGNLRYRYRLVGFDADWIDAARGSTSAVYTNLPPGNYRFVVQGLPKPNDWERGEAASAIGEAALDFRLVPPLWQRAWFIAAAALLATLALAAVWVIRIGSYRRRQAQLSRMVDESTRELREKNAALEHAAEERTRLMDRLETLASHDELTQLPNRRAGRARLEQLVAEGRRMRVAMLDMDHFKRVNDQYGHEAGDHVLSGFARMLLEHARDPRDCARLGGEEFLLLLPDVDVGEAFARCESLRQAVETARIPVGGAGTLDLHCTVSIGLSAASTGRSADELLREADQALYRAKANGRNRIWVTPEPAAT